MPHFHWLSATTSAFSRPCFGLQVLKWTLPHCCLPCVSSKWSKNMELHLPDSLSSCLEERSSKDLPWSWLCGVPKELLNYRIENLMLRALSILTASFLLTSYVLTLLGKIWTNSSFSIIKHHLENELYYYSLSIKYSTDARSWRQSVLMGCSLH